MRKNKYVFGFLFCGLCACIIGACGKKEPQLLLAEEEVQGSQADFEEDIEGSEERESEEQPLTQDNIEEDTQEEKQEGAIGEVYVYVCGEVNAPGVYVLPEGSRICDVVEAAGGLTEKASTSYWNQAQLLTDGMMLCFPTEEEAKNRLGDFYWNESFTDGNGQAASATEDGEKDSGNAVSNNGKVNINTATEAQLMTIPGIGASKAKSIISYRNENGKFLAIEDIMNVSGIKEGLFQQIKEYIMVY